MGPRKSKKTAPKSKRSEEAAADSNPKKKAKSEPAPAAREPDVHKMKWDHLWKEFAEADNPGEMTLEGFADLLEKADIDCTSAPALVLCWKLDFKLRNSSQVVQHDDYSGYFRFDRETVGGLKRELETSRFDAASLDIDEFREFYRFAFQFQRQSTKKGVERDLLVEVIPLVFPEHATGAASERGAFATQFVAFLKDLEGDAHESLTFDEWTQFLEFSLTHAHDPQCKEYDEAAAWPLLIDDFVDYIQRDGKAKK